MIRRITIIAGILLLAGSVARPQVLSYGARLGMGFPGFVDEKIASQRITLVTSLVGSWRITPGLNLMIEPGFQRKGNKFTNQVWDSQGNVINDSTYLVKTNLDYITVPLYLRVNLGRTSKFYLQAGGYGGYLVHANFTGMRLGEMVKKVPVREGLEPFDYGIVAGGGIETPIRQGLGVVLDIKYQYGLKDLNRNPQILGYSRPVRNKGLTMSMGFYVDVD